MAVIFEEHHHHVKKIFKKCPVYEKTDCKDNCELLKPRYMY